MSRANDPANLIDREATTPWDTGLPNADDRQRAVHRPQRPAGTVPAYPSLCPQSQWLGPFLVALKQRTDAVYVLPVPLLFANRVRINTLALGARLPTLHGVREYVEAGGLMSYGPNWADLRAHFADGERRFHAMVSRHFARS